MLGKNIRESTEPVAGCLGLCESAQRRHFLYFDNMSHEWTMKFIEHRLSDRRILRLIRKWLKAGVSEDGQWSETKLGTPQEQWFHHCSPTCTCITPSIYGAKPGGRKWRRAM